jgi:hypothetical protein
MLDTGCWMLYAGCWMMDAESGVKVQKIEEFDPVR